MAWLQADPSGNFHLSFRFGGRKFKRSLKTKSERDANAKLLRLEENIRLVESGRLEIPDNGDIPKFLLSDGKIAKKVKVKPKIGLSKLFDLYLEAMPDGAMEDNTIGTLGTHRRHLERLIGKNFDIHSLTQRDLQSYVTKRSKEKGIRGRALSAVTIRKETTSLRAVWNWAVSADLVSVAFPNRGLKYPKTQEKPPFQTWNEITAAIASSNLSAAAQQDLWDCLFLSNDQIAELLEFVKENARHPFIYPMFFMAAHTGARRSELLRSQLSDFRDGFVTIREKKRVRGQSSTRRVPVSQELRKVIERWRAVHPGGPYTFCMGDILRSPRHRQSVQPITHDVAHDHFERTLAESKWSVIRGWHCLRHSFCSNCALKGIDQRLIDSWVGHTTDSMRRRYRHLFPTHETESLNLVFA
ncbi:MAG: site-specific integrase [Planctomycetota bacterium]